MLEFQDGKSFLEKHRKERPIVLVGMMGAGKTTVGHRLSQALRWPFYDIDAAIEHHGQCDISSFFSRHGEPAFRALEEEIVARLMRVTPCVLAAGGGAVLSQRVRKLIFEDSVALWLHADVDVLVERVAECSRRPLLKHGTCRETLHRLLEERLSFYERAHVTVPVYQEPPEQTFSRVLHSLAKAKPDVIPAYVWVANQGVKEHA